MAFKIYIDGTLHDPETARISVLDRGFLYGDSIYEAMRTSGGEPVDLAAHLARLGRSAAAMALPLPDNIEPAIRATLAAAENPESYVRVMVTRGGGEITLDPAMATGPSLIVIVRPLVTPPPQAYARGIKLGIVTIERMSRKAVDPAIKSGNYLNNILALREAREAGADEAVMCDSRGRIAEGASSNIFVVRGQRVTTPALHIGLLQGITRERVMDLARADGIAIDSGTLTPEDVLAAEEVFITSSVRTVVPVAQVNDQVLKQPAPGPVTKRIMELYRQFLDEVAAGARD